jgi:hypothetical protein
MLGLAIDPDANEYMASAAFASHPEYRWPGSATAYREIRRLLPNHYLDLDSGRAARFWPDTTLEPVGFEEAADRSAGLLRGLVAAAARRFELVVPVTAGVDSRVVLGACRDLRDRVSYATLRQWHVVDDSPDVTVAAEMLAALGLAHTVIRADKKIDPQFAQVFHSSTWTAHPHYLPDAAAILAEFGRQKVVLTGSGGEVARSPFREHLPWFDRVRVTPRYLSVIAKCGRGDFSVRNFAQWLEDLEPDYGFNPLDLFEWEQECGSWLAMVEAEFDAVWHDIFTPFNCRALLATMLATSPSCRKGSRCLLFDEIIRRLWPQLLDFPVNPHTQLSRPRAWGRGGRELLRYLAHPFRHRR